MRDRRQQGIAQTFRFHGDTCGRGLFGPLCALDRERNLAGKGLEEMALFGEQQAAALGRLNGEHTECLVRARERQVLSSGGGERVGAETSRTAVVEHPLSDRKIGVLQRSGLRTLEVMQAALGIGQQHGGAARKGLVDVFDRDARQVVEAAGGGKLAAHGVEQRGAPLARSGHSRLSADVRDEVRDDERHHQHHGERQRGIGDCQWQM